MNAVTVFCKVPYLLDTCVCDDVTAVRILRLVSKELSQVAMTSLRSHSLRLLAFEDCRAVCVARLLRQTQLRHLRLNLLLSGSFSPASLLETFAREAGPSLTTLASFELCMQDTSGSRFMAAAVDNALAVLLETCPALTSFAFSGQPSHDLLKRIGEVCPLLSTLSITHPGPKDLLYLQNMLQLQPILLPNLSSLTFSDSMTGFTLPNIHRNHGIVFLDVQGCIFSIDSHWLSLPCNLQVLRCENITSGPPPLENGGALPRLQRLEMSETAPHVPLKAIAQLVGVAPALLCVTAATPPAHPSSIIISLQLTHSTASATSDELSLLLPVLASGVLNGACFLVDCSQTMVEEHLGALITTLPRMTGVERCILSRLEPNELSPFLACFPNLVELDIQSAFDLDDLELQDLCVCASLTIVRLLACGQITPVGILSLCHGLPGLRLVEVCNCQELGEEKLEKCEQLLLKRGLLTKVIDVEIQAA